jgi:hypothetical protein
MGYDHTQSPFYDGYGILRPLNDTITIDAADPIDKHFQRGNFTPNSQGEVSSWH